MYITILKTYIHTCHNNDIYIMHISSQARQARLHQKNNTAAIIPGIHKLRIPRNTYRLLNLRSRDHEACGRSSRLNTITHYIPLF